MTGICLYNPKIEFNFGAVMRLAVNFNVDFVCTIRSRYKRLSTDVLNASKLIPVFHYDTFDNFYCSRPVNCALITLEVGSKLSLEQFVHPKNVVYIFGPEDGTLSKNITEKCTALRINTNHCLNVAMCAGIVLYDRYLKNFQTTTNH